MKFKVGDRVKVVKKTSTWNKDGLMDKWIGKTMTIVRVIPVGYFMKEDCSENDGGWIWGEECLEPCQFTKADLKPCMVVKRRNGTLTIVTNTKNDGLCLQTENNKYIPLNGFEESMIHKCHFCDMSKFDIIKVFGFSGASHLAFEISEENREVLFERIEESPQQIKLKELEQKQRDIADEIKKIREESK